jgi:hypothetical protein
MSALANNTWDAEHDTTMAAMAMPKESQQQAVRVQLMNLRDTLLVLSLQLVFRATTILRHWNY